MIEFMDNAEVQLQHGLTKGISLPTAQVWMHMLDYRRTKDPCGQFVDGHECADVVEYCNKVFLPTIEALHPQLRL